MKKLILLILTIAVTSHFTHAELLIIKKGPEGLMPLDERDKSNEPMLATTLLNYEWPAVIANTSLAPKEQDALLSPNKPHAEEDFIREKIKKINPDYDIVFIPTSLYEIFVMSQCNNPDQVLRKVDKAAHWDNEANLIEKALNKWAENRKMAYERIYVPYKKYNSEFYKGAFFYINNALTSELFTTYPELKKLENGPAMATYIQNIIYRITTDIIKKGLPALEKCGNVVSYVSIELKKDPYIIDPQGPLARSIAVEYEARRLNKGLLFRGTSLIKQTFGQERVVTLAGGTLKEENLQALANAYKWQDNETYSISFGNSLFAGAAHDKGATVYFYLTHKTKSLPGYALLIDKQAYYKDNCNDLFFISPLTPLAALFASGGLFHSRTKAARAKKKKDRFYYVPGISETIEPFSDPFGILLIQRDPLYHAELFSNFLAHNMRVLKNQGSSFHGDKDLTDKEKDALEAQLKAAQKQAAEYYRAIRVLEPWATEASKKFKKKREKKKAATKEVESAKS